MIFQTVNSNVEKVTKLWTNASWSSEAGIRVGVGTVQYNKAIPAYQQASWRDRK